MPHYVLDTSALKYRYLVYPPPDPLNVAKFPALKRHIRRVVSDQRNQCYIAENTMFELLSAIGGVIRSRPATGPPSPMKLYNRMIDQFHQDVADRRLIVRKASVRDFQIVRHLLRTVGVVQRRALGSLDAIIAASALELAYELKEKVTLYTADKRMAGIITDLEPFKSAMKCRYLLK